MNGKIFKIDRIDNRGNITSHLTRTGLRTLCGRDLRGRTQPWCNNGLCRGCEKIARALSEVLTGRVKVIEGRNVR